MKKQIISFVMMLALVIVAGTAMAQTSTTPYLGGTYSYTVSGLDQVSNARFVEVYITDGSNAKQALTSYTANAPTTGLSLASGTLLYNGALAASPTTPASIGFNIDYATTGLTAGTTYRLWIKIYNGTSATGTCYNAKFLNIVPAANNFNLAMATPSTSICQTITPDGTLAVGTSASASQNTVFTYTITKTGGDNNDDWSFDFKIPTNTLGLDIANISSIVPTITTGAGTNTVSASGSITAGTYNVKVANSDTGSNASVVTITITVPTTTGVADAAFAATASVAKLYVNQTTTVSIGTETSGADNAATVTLKNLPTIGTFSGN